MYVINIAYVALVGGVIAYNGRPIYRLKWSPGLYAWINISQRLATDQRWKGISQGHRFIAPERSSPFY